jgi:hypothetical protein
MEVEHRDITVRWACRGACATAARRVVGGDAALIRLSGQGPSDSDAATVAVARLAPAFVPQASVRESRDRTLAADDEQASDLARALCLLAARSESSHPEGQLAPGEPTAILISWRLFGDPGPRIWLS